ncbi:MAG: lipoprotein, partial [Bacilli bacterium]|nr:lipoprotein [Bacilli bacterium]
MKKINYIIIILLIIFNVSGCSLRNKPD